MCFFLRKVGLGQYVIHAECGPLPSGRPCFKRVALWLSSLRRVACSYDTIARCAVLYFSHCLRFHHGDMSLGGDRREKQTRLLIHGAPLSIPAVLLFMHKGFA